MEQIELLERPRLTERELTSVVRDIRNLYWMIRNTRRGVQDAQRRRVYRQIETHKKRLLMAGVSKEEILRLLAVAGQACAGRKAVLIVRSVALKRGHINEKIR
ncbi:hypothetical protein [Burkholderia sp. MSMB1589WGS]|uniref:hypothetical protein n=1 Tax=Burkholderia sp. MSMB1589WGS TaxID=1636425 RepID=UPI001E395DEC|nr:hypothetical protein [Burkholderia sp. MSMB1589WGS]